MTNYAYGVIEQARVFTGKVQEVSKIANLKWDKPKLSRGEEVNITAEVKGIDEGTKATIEIYSQNPDEPKLIESIKSTVKDKKVQAIWTFNFEGSTSDLPIEGEARLSYKNPSYFFRVIVKDKQADSEPIEFKDTIIIRLRNEDGDPIANAGYVVLLADGSERKGKLDDKGFAQIGDVPPGRYWVKFPDYKKST
jgi:hypothetical protein